MNLRYNEISPQRRSIPKNVNEYRHIMEDKKSQESDIEWILDLRENRNSSNYDSLKNSVGEYPDIYRKSFDSYKLRVEKEKNDNKNNLLHLKGNIKDFEHLIKRRIGIPTTLATIGFETTLRKFHSDKNINQKAPWKTLSGLFINKNYLPPTQHNSIVNLEKIKSYVSRPYEQILDVN